MSKYSLTLPGEISIKGINIGLDKGNGFFPYWHTPEEGGTHIEQYHDNFVTPTMYEE